jgi:ABC-type bacteriocin/lantibiotic exporter with double-glycine peptidase domain
VGNRKVLPVDGASAHPTGLARVLLRLPTLFVLDECTANLDDQTESELALSLNSLKGDVTMIIISHKRGLLKFADQIVDITGKNPA